MERYWLEADVDTLSDADIGRWFGGLSDGDIDFLLSRVEPADFGGGFRAEDMDDLIGSYRTFGVVTVPDAEGADEFGIRHIFSTDFLRRKAKEQLRDDDGRWRRMLARVAHRVTRGKIGAGKGVKEKYGLDADGNGRYPDITPDDTPRDREIKPHAARIAEQTLRRLVGNEQRLTDQLTKMADKRRGRMAGLEFRIKTRGSTFDKLFNRAVQKNLTVEQMEDYADKFPDALRYTMILHPDRYMDEVASVLAELEASGDRAVEVSNMWAPDNLYKGLHAKMQSPDGAFWELQFHTEKSFLAKSKNHALYEIARDAAASDAERAEAMWRMKDRLSQVPSPRDWWKHKQDGAQVYEDRLPFTQGGDFVPRPESVPDIATARGKWVEYGRRMTQWVSENRRWALDTLDEFREG